MELTRRAFLIALLAVLAEKEKPRKPQPKAPKPKPPQPGPGTNTIY
jgi:hypothetical protein